MKLVVIFLPLLVATNIRQNFYRRYLNNFTKTVQNTHLKRHAVRNAQPIQTRCTKAFFCNSKTCSKCTKIISSNVYKKHCEIILSMKNCCSNLILQNMF